MSQDLLTWLVTNNYDLILVVPRVYHREGVISIILESLDGLTGVIGSKPLSHVENARPYLFAEEDHLGDIMTLFDRSNIDFLIVDHPDMLQDLPLERNITPKMIGLCSWYDLPSADLQSMFPRLQVVPLHLRREVDKTQWVLLEDAPEIIIDNIAGNYPATQLISTSNEETFKLEILTRHDDLLPHSEGELNSQVVYTTTLEDRVAAPVIHIVHSTLNVSQILDIIGLSYAPQLMIYIYSNDSEYRTRIRDSLQSNHEAYQRILNLGPRVVVQEEELVVDRL